MLIRRYDRLVMWDAVDFIISKEKKWLRCSPTRGVSLDNLSSCLGVLVTAAIRVPWVRPGRLATNGVGWS